MPFLAGFVTPQDFGALGNGTANDAAAINAALAYVWTTYGGGVVMLPPTDAGYGIGASVTLPPYTYLAGQSAVSANLFATMPTALSRLVALASWAPGSATGVVVAQSKTLGGWSVNPQSNGVRNVVIDCSLNTSANLNGIYLTGPVFDTHVEDTLIWTAPAYGLSSTTQSESGITATSAYHLRLTRVSAVGCASGGFNIANLTDSTFTDCLASGTTAGNGWNLNANNNSKLVGCRGELSSSATAGRGFDVTGAPGSVELVGCSSQQNACEGLRVHAATPGASDGGGIVVAGFNARADGTGGTNPAGVKITGSSVPVAISALNVQAAQIGSSWWPTTGIEIDTSSNVIVAGAVLQGVTTPWSDGGGNTNLTRAACFGLSGDPNSQALVVLPGQPTGVIGAVTATTTINTTGLQALQSATVPANTPGPGAVFHVLGSGFFTASSGTLTLALYWGGTSGTALAATPAITPAAVSGGSFWYEGFVTFRSATTCVGALNICLDTSSSTDAAATYIATPASVPTTVTTSANEALAVAVTWSAAAQSISLTAGLVERVA